MSKAIVAVLALVGCLAGCSGFNRGPFTGVPIIVHVVPNVVTPGGDTSFLVRIEGMKKKCVKVTLLHFGGDLVEPTAEQTVLGDTEITVHTKAGTNGGLVASIARTADGKYSEEPRLWIVAPSPAKAP